MRRGIDSGAPQEVLPSASRNKNTFLVLRSTSCLRQLIFRIPGWGNLLAGPPPDEELVLGDTLYDFSP